MSLYEPSTAKISPTLKAMRRVITGVDAQGRSVITHEGQAPGQHENDQWPGRGYTDFWVWRKTPQPLHGREDTGLWPDEFPGPAPGGHLRVVHWLSKEGRPGTVPVVPPHAPKRVGVGGRSWDRGGGNNTCISDMHKTESVDFGIVLEGERILVCDDRETTIRPGDIVVQVGAWHLWNSEAKGCHMAFDMVSAAFSGTPDGNHGLQEKDVQVLRVPEGKALPAGVKPQRRIVTIDREPGRSVIVSDGASPDVRVDPARPGFALHRLWVIETHPAPIVPESLQLPHVLVPPPRGTVLNVLTLPPDAAWRGKAGVEQAQAFYASVGAQAIATCGSIEGHPYSQNSDTVEFLVVTEGEVTLVLDTGETTLKAGEIGVVRGGNRALANRTGRPAVVAIATHDAVAGS
ncbi:MULTISPECIES: hypothetical protein [Ramlibacter]|uniref:Cupin domain-containing protein n=1 Tax=Ramlibacter pinisoli TaxID=2682844 RepID=A0A6N8IZM9_9BURK|nr:MULTISPECIES: hypothetical protein [Ramlibacter]MBA2961452.1 hypothetical protein [Ramlibacter sp. CGMCC 1.13660]MVQ31396.1 hypothetical protein [Ramlibacter pinisoli]